MTELPKSIRMRAVVFGDGHGGYAMHGYIDDHDLGIEHISTREGHGRPWTSTWSWQELPGRVFGSYAELAAAAGSKLPAVIVQHLQEVGPVPEDHRARRRARLRERPQ